MKKIVKTKCPICQNENNIVERYKIQDTRYKIQDTRYKILLCPDCKTEYLFPQPTFEEIKSIYTSEYYAAWGMNEGENESVANMKKKTFYNMLMKIKKYKSSGNILDVGTASGFLLEEAHKLGFNVFGVELSEYSSSIAKNKFGDDKIYNGTLETSQFENNFFDVITMCDLLEHVSDPIQTLQHAKEKLKDDGIIVIVFPDTFSFTSRVMKSKWSQYKLEHLFYFNKASMLKISKILDLKLSYFKKAEKTMTLSYMNYQFSVYKLFLVTQLFKVIGSIPLIKNFGFNITLGESMVILSKIKLDI